MSGFIAVPFIIYTIPALLGYAIGFPERKKPADGRARIKATPIVAKHVYEGNLTNTLVIGTGPFKFVDWVKGSNITLAANDARAQ